jgi:hypothetical protein
MDCNKYAELLVWNAQNRSLNMTFMIFDAIIKCQQLEKSTVFVCKK